MTASPNFKKPGDSKAPAAPSAAAARTGPGAPRADRSRWIGAVPVLVFLFALVMAAITFLQFLQAPRVLWASVVHDRNAHYLFGLSLARDIRHLNFGQLLSDLDGARTWPPLFGILESAPLLAGGFDYRLSVLPSLAGWVGTVLLGYLLARRIAPRARIVAGLLVVVFVVASPAHRAYATDTMLESLGACLSLLVLYLYVSAVQAGTLRAWRLLALALTALFFFKFNYWFLDAVALLLAELSTQPKFYGRFLIDAARAVSWRSWLRNQCRHPLTYVLAVLASLLVWLTISGGTDLNLGETRVSLHSPHNLLQLAYIVLFVRVSLWCWSKRSAWSGRLDPRLRLLLCWHGLPVALWFLLPKRIGYWIWFMSPTTNVGIAPEHNLADGARFYWERVVQDYHVGFWSALAALILCVLGLRVFRQLRPGGRAVIFFLLLSASLTVSHPNQKSRYAHTWVAASWVVAGVGLASFYRRGSGARFGFRRWLPAGALAGMALAHSPAFLQRGHSPEWGHNNASGSTRDLSDYFLDFTAQSRRTALLATVEMKHLFRWSILERLGRCDRCETDLKGFGGSPEVNRRSFERWLKTTRCDTIVFVDMPPGSYFYEFTNANADLQQLGQLLEAQKEFHLLKRRYFPQYGCSIAIWSRKDLDPPSP